MSEILNDYIDYLERKRKTERTIINHRTSVNRLVKFLEDSEGVQTGQAGMNPSSSGYQNNHTNSESEVLVGVTEIDAKKFQDNLKAKYKASTFNQSLMHVRSFYNYLVEQGKVPDNPFKFQEFVTEQRSTPKWLTRNEQNHLIRTIRKHGNIKELAMVTTLLHTGLRIQEICDLKQEHVQLTERTGKVFVQQGKMDRQRTIKLNKSARETLKTYLEQFQPTGIYLFESQRSPQMTTRSVQHIIKKYKKLTGIAHLTAHALRHTFGHELVNNKVPFDVVAQLMGHMKEDGSPNIEMTMKYTQPGQEDMDNAVDSLSWI
ncbi:integrase/recombinase XerC/integrase/recombinase XerD [Halobacillus alkaliphilus]|uniref:Integrase/recombinase XerC/integrase/recombinase XerD n=1 Tax=Halobacillus alkaliphilus TaxID=396056 RepID=A0A1I2N5I4_9BACI|nr:tyrosine-type recombinase/integrase [Halobacillus alkaliphilus]SFF99032.1 integrase/recombinase XerC/integrase/recombinase XerD [Halobacillus alkaliphilus]